MNQLSNFLIQKGYTRIKLRLNKTNHFEIKATINGVKGLFILDTGASNSCVDIKANQHFHLSSVNSNVKATGAGASEMETEISKKNKIKIGKWTNNSGTIILFNLIHVNTGLISQNASPVDGIIGADILKKAQAVIDYKQKYLYLKL